MKEKIEYSRQEIVEVLREILDMILSLDRIGGCASDMPEGQWKEATIEYLVDSNLLDRLAKCRRILEGPFEDEQLGDDDMTDLERELKNVKSLCWKFSEYKTKHDL